MGKSRDGTVTPRYVWMLEGRKLSTTCHRCKCPVAVGDAYHSTAGNKYTKFKIYHLSCWNLLFLDVPDEEEFTFTQPRTKTTTEKTQTEVKVTT